VPNPLPLSTQPRPPPPPRPPRSRSLANSPPISLSFTLSALTLTLLGSAQCKKGCTLSFPSGHVNALPDLSTYTPTRPNDYPSLSCSFSPSRAHPFLSLAHRASFSIAGPTAPPVFSPGSARHFLFLLNYPPPGVCKAPLEGFHGRRLKSGSLCHP
jgi:hypothetical protein